LVVVQAIPGFNGLDEDLRSTFLNLIQEFMMKYWQGWNYEYYYKQFDFVVEEACRRLAIVQNREPLVIRKFVGFLSQGF
jgi:hypothetical protein